MTNTISSRYNILSAFSYAGNNQEEESHEQSGNDGTFTVDKSDFEELVKECTASGIIDQNLYTEYDVKRGLRDSNGNGVLTGLTEISDVLGNQSVHGRKIPVDGELYFQGYNVEELIKRSSLDRFRFEEATYLLLFGVLPDKDQLDRFIRILTDLRNFQEHSSEMLL